MKDTGRELESSGRITARDGSSQLREEGVSRKSDMPHSRLKVGANLEHTVVKNGDRNTVVLYDRKSKTEHKLAADDFKYLDVDGSIFAIVEDRSGVKAEIHSGDHPSRKYVLLRAKSGDFVGMDAQGGMHEKYADGTHRVEYLDCRAYIGRQQSDGRAFVISYGVRPGDSFYVERDSKGVLRYAARAAAAYVEKNDLDLLITGKQAVKFFNQGRQFDRILQNVKANYLKIPHDTWEQLRFQKDLIAFQDRIVRQYGSDSDPACRHFQGRPEGQDFAADQIRGTYVNIDRILRAGHLPVNQRSGLAQQMISQSAYPTSIDQGDHPTCTVAALESRIYNRYPREATGLVSDVAASRQYVSGLSAVQVNLDSGSLVPQGGTASCIPLDGTRSYASQIFQLTAANILHEKTGDNKCYRQYINPGTRKLEEGLYQKNAKGWERVASAPVLSDTSLEEIGDEISGLNDPSFTLSHSEKWGGSVSRQEDLTRELSVALTRRQFPLLITVHTGNEPFRTDSNNAESGWHEVAIFDYDPVTGTCGIDNQWGTDSDHICKDRVPVELLYKAMLKPARK